MKTEIKTDFYNTGKTWVFDNGQFGEQKSILQQDVYSLQIIDNKVTGLYFHQNNNCGGQHLNSACYSLYNLSGVRLEMYNKLISLNNTL